MSEVTGESAVPFRSGFVVIIGAPNVGKSTLLNSILGRKISIVTPKPQTTRNPIRGVKNLPGAQIVFVDTPGIHRPSGLMRKRMVQAALDSLIQVDVALWVLDSVCGVTEDDREIVARLDPVSRQPIQVLNKIDRVQKSRLLPLMEECSKLLPDSKIVPVSAQTGEGIDILTEEILKLLPLGPALYPADEITNQTERFLVSEAVREQIFVLTHHEVPYACGVVVEKFEEKPEKNLVVISATVLVERDSHKAILIGRQGAKLKEIGTRSRREIENLLGKKVYLELFVKSKEGWTDNAEILAEMGI